MNNEVLLVSNKGMMGAVEAEKILDVVSRVQKSGRIVHCFYEDIELFRLLSPIEGIVFIRALSSGADKILFEKDNKSIYSSSSSITVKALTNHSAVKRSLTRYAVPLKDSSFDEQEHVSRRLAVCYNRLNYVVSNVYKDYQFIVHFKDSKAANNILKELKPEHGDGKFIYEYDCTSHLYSFAIGGLFFKEDDFNKILKEVC